MPWQQLLFSILADIEVHTCQLTEVLILEVCVCVVQIIKNHETPLPQYINRLRSEKVVSDEEIKGIQDNVQVCACWDHAD